MASPQPGFTERSTSSNYIPVKSTSPAGTTYCRGIQARRPSLRRCGKSRARNKKAPRPSGTPTPKLLQVLIGTLNEQLDLHLCIECYLFVQRALRCAVRQNCL